MASARLTPDMPQLLNAAILARAGAVLDGLGFQQ
jgi:hypothetical protein